MQLWYASVFMCIVAACYGSDGEQEDHETLSNGHQYDRNLQEIRQFLQQLDYTIYNLAQFSAKVHHVLDLEMFNFDQLQGRTLGDMLYAILREQRDFNESLNMQNAQLKQVITHTEVKDLITQAINGRFCNLENRMNVVEKHLKIGNPKIFEQNN